MDILARVQSNPTLRPTDYRAIIDALPYKQREWANWLCVSEEHLSRVLSGKKIASFTTEKLFRFHAAFELTKGMDAPDAIRIMRGTVDVSLTPFQLVAKT